MGCNIPPNANSSSRHPRPPHITGRSVLPHLITKYSGHNYWTRGQFFKMFTIIGNALYIAVYLALYRYTYQRFAYGGACQKFESICSSADGKLLPIFVRWVHHVRPQRTEGHQWRQPLRPTYALSCRPPWSTHPHLGHNVLLMISIVCFYSHMCNDRQWYPDICNNKLQILSTNVMTNCTTIIIVIS